MARLLYNGVWLPEIPNDLLAQYPYAWIRLNKLSGCYDLVFGTYRYYRSNDGSAITLEVADQTQPWYRVEIETANEADAWVFNKDTTGTWTIDIDRPVFWTNHDIMWSVGSDAVYFRATVPTVSADADDYHAIKTETLTQIADAIRGVTGSSELLSPTSMAMAIASIKFDKTEQFFAANFPSDVWADGEYTGHIQSIPVTMKYKYRKDRNDPKNIEFVGYVESPDIESPQIIRNLADFYILGGLVNSYRIQANSNNGLSEILYRNPVVPVVFDLSDYYSAMVGMEVPVFYYAIQCGVKTYDGTTGVSAVETCVNYRVDSPVFELLGGYPASILYQSVLQLNWYHEMGYAFGCRGGNQYIQPSVTLTKNGTYWPGKHLGYDGTAEIIVDVKSSAVVGAWRFNDTLDFSCIPEGINGSHPQEDVKFTSSDYYDEIENFVSIWIFSDSIGYSSGYGATTVYYPNEGWRYEASKTVDFGATPQVVSSDFYEWLTANATPVYTVG